MIGSVDELSVRVCKQMSTSIIIYVCGYSSFLNIYNMYQSGFKVMKIEFMLKLSISYFFLAFKADETPKHKCCFSECLISTCLSHLGCVPHDQTSQDDHLHRCQRVYHSL